MTSAPSGSIYLHDLNSAQSYANELKAVFDNQRNSDGGGEFLFSDETFPHNDYALQTRFPTVHSWKRPPENVALFPPDGRVSVVNQGRLGDSWLLGALAVIATRKDLLVSLIRAAEPSYGFYQVRFWRGGQWRVATIDDWFPCNNFGKPIFGRCEDSSEIWVMVVEKAYCKLHGTYEALMGGTFSLGITDLLGCSTQQIYLADPRTQEEIVSGALWQALQRNMSQGFVTACAFSSHADGATVTPANLLMNHVYGITELRELGGQQLLRIRNPWPVPFRGEEPDASVAQIIRTLAAVEGDGVFWVSFNQFLHYFNKIYVALLFNPKHWVRVSLAGEWRGKTAGGCVNHPTWKENPQYTLSTQTPNTTVFVALQQQDAALGHHEYPNHIGFYVMHTDEVGRMKRRLRSSDIHTRGDFGPCREVTREFVIQPNEKLVVIPCTFLPEVEMQFNLIVHADQAIRFDKIEPDVIAIANGEWSQETAGGCINHPTWRLNPQFCLYIDTKEIVSIELSQPNREVAIGFYVVRAKQPRQKLLMCDVVAKTSFVPGLSVSCEVLLEPSDLPYLVIPCTFNPGYVSPFQLSAGTRTVCQLTPTPREWAWHVNTVKGAWRGSSAGGCQNTATWVNNPYYRLVLDQPTNFVILLSQDEIERPLGIGFYVCQEPREGAMSPANVRDTVSKSDFVVGREVAVSFLDVPPKTYLVIPCTYEANQEGSFALTVFSDCPVRFSLHTGTTETPL
eukprot:gnl/Spiro4/4266_TR2142_c0_g1_i2.p1 gnl/Spiro4/4266_TR2142_c0_g1~~gnl/Spiro4/4266_TR2142_c0_g1_i2.p1  ORF type:complete len:765 (-),score=166.85 gnl/Spiro4/4266_TR2142_c0_g1_i2:125-2329(-)